MECKGKSGEAAFLQRWVISYIQQTLAGRCSTILSQWKDNSSAGCFQIVYRVWEWNQQSSTFVRVWYMLPKTLPNCQASSVVKNNILQVWPVEIYVVSRWLGQLLHEQVIQRCFPVIWDHSTTEHLAWHYIDDVVFGTSLQSCWGTVYIKRYLVHWDKRWFTVIWTIPHAVGSLAVK